MRLFEWISRSEMRELRMRRFSREAQGTRVAGCAFGPPFFWVLFFGGAKKSISAPAGAKPAKNLDAFRQNNNRACKARSYNGTGEKYDPPVGT